VVDLEDLRRNTTKLPENNGPVRVVYNSRPSFKRITKALGLMDDFKVQDWGSFTFDPSLALKRFIK
jgi:hypothetical protein